jgi:competence ComEA-like helix-hairpin-helix protein
MTGCRTHTARSVCFLFALLMLWATQGLYAKKKPPLHPVNINTASAAQLQEVPGIGPVTAQKILQARKSYGTFKSVDDLQAIKGIGPKKLDKMRRYLMVTKPGPNKNASAQPAKNAPAKKSEAKLPTAKPTSAASEDEEP